MSDNIRSCLNSTVIISDGKGDQTKAPPDAEVTDTITDTIADESSSDSDSEGTKDQEDKPTDTNNNVIKVKKRQVFHTEWLQKYPWLKYEDDKMWCTLCVDNQMNNSMCRGTCTFKTSTLLRHMTGADHKNALLAKSQAKNLEKVVQKVLSREEEAVITSMKIVYFMARENIPLSKYKNMMGLHQHLNTPHIDDLKVNNRIGYTSYTTAVEHLSSIANVINQKLTKQMSDSPYITILADESTDIVVHQKLCITARILDPLTLNAKTIFLADIHIKSATGEVLCETIVNHLTSRQIPLSKVRGLGTDGAKTMTGTKNGLTGRLLRLNPHLVNTHCTAHRLALVSEQAAANVPAYKDFQKTLESIFYHFKKSPKKVEALHAVQNLLEEPAIKYREIHEIRWLSTYDAITSLYRTLDSFITYCSNSDNPSATGLRKKVATTMFISVLYSMMDILRPIMELSLVFQTKDLDIGKVKVCLNNK